MTKAKNLDLESQIQLLTRVRFITRFGSHLIHLSGAAGSGKTWLAHSFLEHYATDCRQVLLMCQSGQTDAQHRTLLLQQFVSQAMFNEHDSLCQSVEHLLAHQHDKLMVVIDDAHLLSPCLVAELWALSLYAAQHSTLQLNIVLFANRGELHQTLTHVAHGSGIVPLALDIDDLSQQEAVLFTERLIGSDQLTTASRRTLKQRLLTVIARPSVLYDFPQSEGVNMTSKASKRPLLVAVIILAVIALAIAGYGLMTIRSHTATDTQPPATIPAVTATVTFDDVPLPPQVHAQGLTVGRKEDSSHERIVISEQQIDAMMDDQALKGHSIATEATTTPVIAPIVAASDTTAIPSLPSAGAIIPAPASKLDWSLKLATDEQKLAAIKSSHYALQLAATQSLAAAAEFMTTHHVVEAMIYQTDRKKQQWFIVVSGNYSTADQARTAKSQLSASLQQLKPWLKPYRHIQQEMNRLK
ncbi:SPOR domain-containing protein [Photobacterium phosphoreum]|uniref:SPOR domain-containing protein n=1 Tax=Photobacterium phosphoreum TaxID=659 RepID=UPI001E52DA2C|nr:AAA family ATPase [Photobacterium phosphoreum]